MVDDQVMCVYCREFYKYEFKRSHHPLWLIQMSIERLESLIDKNQTEHLCRFLERKYWPYRRDPSEYHCKIHYFRTLQPPRIHQKHLPMLAQ